jgi:hypothetical protein
VALLALTAALNVYQRARAVAAAPDPYKIDQQAERFRGVAARVPPGAVMGFLTDQTPESIGGHAMYFGAQYALAPRLLVWNEKDTTRRWVLGNFATPVDLSQVAKAHGLKLAADFGSGVALFEKEGQ